MAENNIKNGKGTAKTRKTTAKKGSILTMESNASRSSSAPRQLDHNEVAQLAHRYWAERGGQHGHDVEDWLRAERELRARASYAAA